MSRGPLGSGKAAAVLGVWAGLLSGMLGIGGGLVVGPALAMAGLPLKRATGTALAVVLPVAVVGVATGLATAPGSADPWAALWIALGGQCGVWLGAHWLPQIRENMLRLAFAALLVYAGLRNLGVFGPWPEQGFTGLAGHAPWVAPAATVGVGVLAGLSAVLFGVGGGVVVVPGLVFLIGGFDLHHAMATSLLAMVPTAAMGVRVAWRQQRIASLTVKALLPAALLGAVAGVALRDLALAPGGLARIFGTFLLWVAWRLGRSR